MKVNRVIYGLAVLGLTATICHADCPIAADLDKGIRFQGDDGAMETFVQWTDGVVASNYSDPDMTGMRSMLGQGVYLLEIIDVEDGHLVPHTRLTFAHEMAASAMPKPVAGGDWRAQTYSWGGYENGMEVAIYAFGEQGTKTFGSCSYDMIPIEVSFDPAGRIELLNYLPELGLAYVVGLEENGQLDRFDYTSIEAVR
ncbi:MAG: hypothetical protein ACRBB0_17175 [Pelagimonas sp.]|uniref:hypothetical protein n=1 Tax=Pelagimonas sp. TaxID=2073170 RepID=UPI003D6C338F